ALAAGRAGRGARGACAREPGRDPRSPRGAMTSTAHAALGRTIVHFDEPYFVTPHAIRRYRERVGRGSDMDIVRRINEGLQRAGPDYPTRRPVAIGDRRQRFVAIVEPPSPE